MTAIAFDTLRAAERLKDAGVEDRAAKAIVEVVTLTNDWPDISKLATKDDLNVLRREFSDAMRQQLIVIMGGTAAIVSIATAIIKLV